MYSVISVAILHIFVVTRKMKNINWKCSITLFKTLFLNLSIFLDVQAQYPREQYTSKGFNKPPNQPPRALASVQRPRASASVQPPRTLASTQPQKSLPSLMSINPKPKARRACEATNNNQSNPRHDVPNRPNNKYSWATPATQPESGLQCNNHRAIIIT